MLSLWKCVRHSSSWIRSNFRHFTRTKKIKLSIKLQFHVMCSPTKTKSKTHQNYAVAERIMSILLRCFRQFHYQRAIDSSLSRKIVFENFLDGPCHEIFTSDDLTSQQFHDQLSCFSLLFTSSCPMVLARN